MKVIARQPAPALAIPLRATPSRTVPTGRDKSADGWLNRAIFWGLTHFAWWWRFAQAIPPLERFFNWQLINLAIRKGPARPMPLSTKAAYTSWSSLVDRKYFSRYLPADGQRSHPSADLVAIRLFRREGETRISSKSTTLFAHFAQWFIDGLLRTEANAQLQPTSRTTSSHEIDLSNLYGLNEAQTYALREGIDGRLRSQFVNGEEFPPFYYRTEGVPDSRFASLPEPHVPHGWLPPMQRRRLFAMPLARSNGSIGFVMMAVLFLREHNRIARLLKAAYPTWDDERIFQTTRNILIVVVIKVAIEDYINHIAPYHFKFRLVAGRRIKKAWYRTNWLPIEFYLLYRWHALVPDRLQFGNRVLPVQETRYHNELLFHHGLWDAFVGATRLRSGQIGPVNTPDFLLSIEAASVNLARSVELRSYNDYRELFGFPRVTSFQQISSNPLVRERLAELYGNVDRIELYAGLYAEDVRPNSPLAPLMGRMIGVDAFSHALTNPLLAERVYNAATFSSEGLEIIDTTRTLRDIVLRNVAQDRVRTELRSAPVSFTI
jgi:prostaglandin-endoperoxide synthase 2